MASDARHPFGERVLPSWPHKGAACARLRPALVGVVNITPDSFSDGGRYLEFDAACRHIDCLLAEGADVIEVGGESTRPAGHTYGTGFVAVDAASQLARIEPVIRWAVKMRGACVSVDTTLAAVARGALDAGASIVNDVSLLGGLGSDELARVVAERDAWLVLMHSRPGAATPFQHVVDEVSDEWSRARDRAVALGVNGARILMDPGLGFGKGTDDNLRLLSGLTQFHRLGHPLFVGASRKSFIAAIEARSGRRPSDPSDRGGGSVAAALAAARAGAAALRVHDVAVHRQAIEVALAIDDAGARSGLCAADAHDDVGEREARFPLQQGNRGASHV